MQSEYQSHLREQYFQDTLRKAKDEALGKMVEAQESLDEARHQREIASRESAEALAAREVSVNAIQPRAPCPCTVEPSSREASGCCTLRVAGSNPVLTGYPHEGRGGVGARI